MAFKTATVNASDVPATLTNYPSYIDWSRLGITTLAEAQSSRVYADSGKVVEWAREVVSATEGHTKVPSLTSTTPIYVDYDGIRADYAVTDTYGRNAVWSVYRSVRHLETDGSDSTGNLNNTDASLSFAAQKIGQGATFNGTSSRITTTTGTTSAGTWSLSMWFKSTANTDSLTLFTNTSGTGSSGYQINVNINASGYIVLEAGAATTTAYNDGNWQKLNVTGDGPGNASAIYINGTSVATGACFNFGTTTIYPRIGVNATGGGTNWYGGQLDEWRYLVGSVQSADWITTEYNNQSDESGFWGTWTDAGGGVTRRVFVVS